MERQGVGLPEGFIIKITDDSVELWKGNRKLTQRYEKRTIVWIVKQKRYDPLKVLEDTFPDLSRMDYICKLYKDVKDTDTGRFMNAELMPGITLTKMPGKVAYYLETPVWVDIEKYVKKEFGGLIINIPEGNAVREWREIYFASKYCMTCVKEIIKDIFDRHPEVLEKPEDN